VSVNQRTATAKERRNKRVGLMLSGDSCTDRALWHLSLILAEIAASCVQREEDPSVLDAECGNGNE
jgi:hypothetical protein